MLLIDILIHRKRSPFSYLEKAYVSVTFAHHFERLRRELGVIERHLIYYKKFIKSLGKGYGE